jgi:hypothetical protein
MAEKSLLTMLRRDVAAIAVKTVYEPPISDAVRKESTARGVPLYLYDSAYHETVAYQSLDLLQRDRDELDKGKALDELLTADEIMILSTGSHCIAVCEVDGRPVGGKAPALLDRLQQAYQQEFLEGTEK